MKYCIVETQDGCTVVEIGLGMSAEDVAERLSATIVDPGPYHDYEDALDALTSLEAELQEKDAGESDLPGTGALEGRDTRR